MEADDPRALTLEESAKITTVINEFMSYEMERIKSHNLDVQDEYLQNTIDKAGALQKELKDYIKRNKPQPSELFVRSEKVMELLIDQYKPELKSLVVQDLKSKLATEIKRLEQEHRTLSQDYIQQKDVVAEIKDKLAKAKSQDDKKALEVRKSVADGEEAKLLDKLKKIEKYQNKYDNRLTGLVDNQAEYDAIMGKTATASKTPTQESSSSEDELIKSSPALQAEKDFSTFMKRLQTEVLSGMNDQQLYEYVNKFDTDVMRNEFMERGLKTMENSRQEIHKKIT